MCKLWCLAGLRNTRNYIVPRECEYLETDSNHRQSRSSGECEIATRMPGTSGPSNASCSSRCYLADVGTSLLGDPYYGICHTGRGQYQYGCIQVPCWYTCIWLGST